MRVSCYRSPRFSMISFAIAILAVGALGISAWAQQPTSQHRAPGARTAAHPATAPGTPAAQQTPKYKGIFEPMNYPADVYLQDVYFVNDKVGWVAGGGRSSPGGFILHTNDGGAHWNLQLGDPQSNTPEVNRFRFLDATHGWAMQGGQLIGTTDGTTWQTIGTLPGRGGTAGGSAGYQFTSLQDGFEIAGDYSGATVYATHDGGRNWKPVYECATTLQVNGLTRNTGCQLHDLRFVTPQVGYAVGGGDHWAVIVKTADSGATWKVIFASTDVEQASTVFFTDESNGVVRLWDGRILITSDGGQNWQGATGNVEAYIKFADPQVGWACTLEGHPDCSYTVDGGKNWLTRNFDFPVDISGYSIPRRDVLYVVGDHGMIYRYRVVPADYQANGIIDAPFMSAYGGVLRDNMQQMKTQLAALQTQLSAASGELTPEPAQQPSSPRSTGPSLVLAAYHPGAAYADPAAQDSAAASPGFTQDVGDASNVPTSSFVQGCCAQQVQNLQTSMTSTVQQVPTFNSQFRVLNLLSVAVNMLSNLTNRAKQMATTFAALKQAPNLQAALADISNLTSQVEDTSQAIDTQFQGLSAAAQGSGTPAGFISNQAAPGPGASGTASANGQPAQPAQQPASQPQPNANSVGNQIKNAIKKKLPF